MAATNKLGNRSTTKRRRKPQLVTTSQEDAVTLLDILKIGARLAFLARLERQDLGVTDAYLPEQLFVVTPGVFELRRRRNNADTRLLATANINKTIENLGIMEFFFCAADRDDIPAVTMASIVGGAHGIIARTCKLKKTVDIVPEEHDVLR